jgi:hypothetical protein
MTLQNTGFEGKTYIPKGQMALVLPEKWEAGWVDNALGPRARPGVMKSLKPEILVITKVQPYLNPPRIADGNASVTMFKLYGTITSWLLQQVPATPGNVYRATAKAHAWARANEDLPFDPHFTHGVGTVGFYAEEGDAGLNDDLINFRFRVGIDPFGGKDPFASAVVWGKGAHIYNVYHAVPKAETMARADSITVFLFVDNLWGFVNSNAFWDTVELSDLGEKAVDYVVVVNLLPQDATKAEKLRVLDLVHESKQTILQSADDAKRLVQPGKPGSEVVVWAPNRWITGNIAAYLAPCSVVLKEFP